MICNGTKQHPLLRPGQLEQRQIFLDIQKEKYRLFYEMK